LIKNIIDKLHYSALRLKAKHELELNQKRYKNGEHIILEDREYYQPVDKKMIRYMKTSYLLVCIKKIVNH